MSEKISLDSSDYENKTETYLFLLINRNGRIGTDFV